MAEALSKISPFSEFPTTFSTRKEAEMTVSSFNAQHPLPSGMLTESYLQKLVLGNGETITLFFQEFTSGAVRIELPLPHQPPSPTEARLYALGLSWLLPLVRMRVLRTLL